ncbi:hypothetical protein PYCCODRAFT_35244 [Trametes coccinea BRFM310]|uniref:Secreted protein n=1 Tax=Trametes coccinea (strain BRFM310) TaxID=1353009 RepID=A0A1Y2J5A5_TRAC3|nr:hypothetical protein PYCCODRAFT_35244 [Trametes coccinea BRFM310]
MSVVPQILPLCTLLHTLVLRSAQTPASVPGSPRLNQSPLRTLKSPPHTHRRSQLSPSVQSLSSRARATPCPVLISPSGHRTSRAHSRRACLPFNVHAVHRCCHLLTPAHRFPPLTTPPLQAHPSTRTVCYIHRQGPRTTALRTTRLSAEEIARGNICTYNLQTAQSPVIAHSSLSTVVQDAS